MRGDLEQLTQAIEAIERRGLSSANSRLSTLLPTNWSNVDQTLGGGLQRGAVHEWFNGTNTQTKAQGLQSLGPQSLGLTRQGWFPPLALFIHFAWRALDQSRDDDDDAGSRFVIWIGRRCWPQLRAMVRNRAEHVDEWCGPPCPHTRTGRDARAAIEFDRTLLERSLFIDPPDDAARLWAIDLALRSITGGIVIADGSRLDMPATRRLQLAAEAGRSIALIARPPHELSELSAATTRWIVRPPIFHHGDAEARRNQNGIESDDTNDPSPLKEMLGVASQSSHPSLRPLRLCGEFSPRWIVQLLRCKGLRPSPGSSTPGSSSLGSGKSFQHATAHNTWAVEWNSAQGCINQLADVVDRPDSPALAPTTRAESDDFIPSAPPAAARRSA